MDNLLSVFGLNREQLEILYSIEHILTRRDISNNPKSADIREKWLSQWLQTLDDSMYADSKMHVFGENEIVEAIKSVSKNSPINTWFYLVMLESALFTAYFAIDEDKESSKIYSKLKYERDTDYLKQIADASGLMDGEYIDRYLNTYKKMYRKISGKSAKAVITGVSIFAASAVVAAIAAVFAGPIAVAIFGPQFALHGAALTSACLAMAGGGAIALGGGGMAMGVAAIAGGGALLGAAGGGAAAVAASAFAKKSPEFTLSQTVKLEVVMREILLNAQHDIESAQEVIARLQDQVRSLKAELKQLQAEQEKDKETIKNLEKSIDMITKAIKDMVIFKSSFEIGLENEDNNDNEDDT